MNKKNIISFDVEPAERVLINKIAKRAMRIDIMHGGDYELLECRMDITACHANGCPIRLADLLKADDFNFAHDIYGIRGHLNRRTGRLVDHFLPRFYDSVKADKTQVVQS